MEISAAIKSAFNAHAISVRTNESVKEMQVSPKPDGFGSSVNGVNYFYCHWLPVSVMTFTGKPGNEMYPCRV